MKALSVRQPWAWLICMGFKDIENRNWSTNFTGRIYIHAGKTLGVRPGSSQEQWILEKLTRHQLDEYRHAVFHRGAIIGEVDVTGCIESSISPWFTGHYGFVLANPVLYPEPIPCNGKLRFFTPDVPAI
jgi:hypothetical protein